MNIRKTGILDGFSVRRDKIIKLSVSFEGLTDDQLKEIYAMQNEGVYVQLSTESTEPDEIFNMDDTDAPFDSELEEKVNDKSKSQRLRNVIYRGWEEAGEPMLNFEAFYNEEMEKVINYAKKKYLEPNE